MFGDQISRAPRIPSPWSARLSASASTSASTTAPPTPPSHHPFGDISHLSSAKDQDAADHQLPALHLLNMSCDDALSDISDEADGFFSLDMDVSIDQQLQDHEPTYAQHNPLSETQQAPAIPSLSERFDASPQHNSREASGSPLLNSAVRRASETVTYSSSPLQGVGLDPIMASRSRNSPVFNGTNVSNTSAATNVDAQNGSPPSSFGPIAPEVDQKGNLEYKLKVLPPSRERFDRLVTQLKWRLLEGGGLAVYEIGVLDDGTLIGLDLDSMKDSLKLLSLMAAEVGANCFVQRVLALENISAASDGAHTNESAIGSQQSNGQPQPTSAARGPSLRLAAAESELSLRALASDEAIDTLQPYILTADMDEDARAELLQTGSAGLYRFDIAEQQTSIPPPLASIDPDVSNTPVASVAAVDPTEVAALATTSEDDVETTLSAQTKRRLLKATNGLPSKNGAPTRAKKDILNGLDQSTIVYLPSKEEKRILRAVEEAAQHDALSHTEARERKMMAKMTRVADSVQPKTARARARARKSAGSVLSEDVVGMADCCSGSPSPTPSPKVKANNGVMVNSTAAGAYTGYENVMSMFGVLSERSARTLFGNNRDAVDEGERGWIKGGRLIVEAVVRRDAE